jgi:hypothetical protein
MAVIVVIALYNQSSLPPYWIIISQGQSIFYLLFSIIYQNNLGCLIGIGIIAVLSSLATKVSVSRDWVVALYGSDRQILASRLFLNCFVFRLLS